MKKIVKLSEIKKNPKNPRTIKNEKFKELVESIKDFPEMLDVRGIVVNSELMILGGRQRYDAMLEAGYTEALVDVVDWDEDRQRKFIIKDNTHNGEWDTDMLRKEWDNEELEKWGVDVEFMGGDNELSPEYSGKLGEVIYEPKDSDHKPTDLYQRNASFDNDIEKIGDDHIKKMLYARTSYFDDFDFAKIADYYAYQATPEEKRLFERLSLVLLDKDGLIENGFSKLLNEFTPTDEE